MFVLSQSHLDAFAAAAVENYEDRLLPFLQERYPEECEALSESGVRKRIRIGLERAPSYEIDSEADVGFFVCLMFGLRPDFDTSNCTAWAGEILRDRDTPPRERLDQIVAEARERGVRRPSTDSRGET